MKVQWENIHSLLRRWRRSGSTTFLKKATDGSTAILVTHSDEWAKEVGGISQGRLTERFLDGRIPAPIVFDNGLLIKMCEDMDSAWAHVGEQGKQITQLREDILNTKDSHRKAIQKIVGDSSNKLIQITSQMKLSADRQRVAAFKLGVLCGNPRLTKKVPINEMKFYLLKGFPNYTTRP